MYLASQELSSASMWHFFKRLLLFTGFIGSIVGVFSLPAVAQTGTLQTNVTSVVHPAPNAASLGKFTDMPVSLHTGLPTVAIPLWDIKQGDIEVAISLSYHAGGIKVDDIASWVGMGWALTAGGVITRSARGLPDIPATYKNYVLPRRLSYQQGRLSVADETHALGEAEKYLINVSWGVEDAEPDLYTISVGGVAGRFFMGDDGNFVVAPRESNLRIAYDVVEPSGQWYAWVITDGKGTQYKFNEAEYNTTTSFSYSGGQGSQTGYSGDAISSWYLTDITDARGNKVHFSYSREGSRLVNKTSEYVNVPDPLQGAPCGFGTGYQLVNSDISTVRLQRITCGREEIVFLPDEVPRKDQEAGFGLKAIQINYDGILKKVFHFYKSYSLNDPIGSSASPFFITQDHYRLRLDSLREKAGNNSSSIPAYHFTYNTRSLPYHNSLAQDHWGFYNGQDNTSGVTYEELGRQKGAKKEPNHDFASAGMLTSVRYPTGGSTAFTYEPNYYVSAEPTVVVLPLTSMYRVNRADSLLTRFAQSFEITPAMVVNSLAIGPHIGYATILTSTQVTPPGPANGYSVRLRIHDASKPLAEYSNDIALGAEQTVELQAGRYLLLGEIETEFITSPENGTLAPTVTLACSLNAQVTYPAGIDRPGPGFRLKQLTKYFGQAITETRTYTYQDSTASHSSGLLGNLPNYKGAVGTRNPFTGGDRCSYTTFSSISTYPLISSAASYIGYSRVTEYYDTQQTLGKKVYTYSNFDKFNDLNNTTAFPYPPASPQDWKRGLPLTEATYQSSAATGASAAQFELQERIVYSYSVLPTSLTFATGLKVGSQMRFIGDYDLKSYFLTLNAPVYPLQSDSYQLQAKITTQYVQGKAFTSAETHEYTPAYFQPRTIRTTTSDGTLMSRHLYYPTDYLANRTASPLLDGLLTANIINLPVEETTSRGTATSQQLVAGTLHLYNWWVDSNKAPRYYEQQQYTLNTAHADLSQQYKFVNIPAHYEEQIRIMGVNSRSQPTAYRRLAKEKTAYQWGYEDRYPTATCKNALPTEFFYESFEELTSASTGAAHSGLRCTGGSYTINWSTPNTRSYLLSYWYRQAGQWYYRQQPYNGPSLTLTGDDAYDEVRIWPSDAQLTTYTYEPLVGMTSQTGPDGRTTFYEYDGLGRLVRTRDEQGRILSQQQYHYAGH